MFPCYYSSLCLHGRLLGEFFVTFTLLKFIHMFLLLIFWHEKLVECTLSLPHVTLPCEKYGFWRTFLSISLYLNKHYASYSNWLIANSPKCLNVYWQYLHNAHGTEICNSKITPHILLYPCLYLPYQHLLTLSDSRISIQWSRPNFKIRWQVNVWHNSLIRGLGTATD